MIMLGVVARFFFIWNSCCKRANYRYFCEIVQYEEHDVHYRCSVTDRDMDDASM